MDEATNPILDGIGVTDNFGVPLASYQHLPLYRGGALDSHAAMTSWLTDALWTGHVGMIGFGIQLLEWVLGFHWIHVILVPLESMTQGVARVLDGIAWAPLALLVAAVVGGIIAFRGRMGAGLLQLSVSAGCFALATSVAVTPLTALTGSDEPITDAQALGFELADAVVRDVLLDSGEASAAASSGAGADGSTSVLAAHLVTVFVRGAAQETAFGGSLRGGPCDDAFTSAMLAEPPGPQRSGVRDAVAGCSESAATYVDQPSLWQPLTVLITMLGSSALLALVGSLVVGLFGAVLACCFSAIRAMIWVHVAILPGVGRRKFGQAVADVITSLASVVVLIVLVAGATALVTNVIAEIGQSGASLTIQMAFVTAVLGSLCVVIASARRRVRATGRSMMSSVARFAAGDDVQPSRPTTVLHSWAVRGLARTQRPQRVNEPVRGTWR